MGTKDWRQISSDEIHFEERELKDQLIPDLRKRTFRNDDWLSWTNQLLADCKTALKPLFPLREGERAFLQSLFEHGMIDARLATEDRNLIEKINFHPLLQWKAKLALENMQKQRMNISLHMKSSKSPLVLWFVFFLGE